MNKGLPKKKRDKEEESWQEIYAGKMIFHLLLKQHVSHSQKAYLIVLFMPIKTTEAKYRYNVMISFLE